MTAPKHSFAKYTLIGLCFFTFLIAHSNETSSINSIQKSTRKWIEIRMQTAGILQDWKLEKSVLENTEAALKSHIASLKSKKILLEAENQEQLQAFNATELDSSRLELVYNNMTSSIDTSIKRLILFRQQLPPRLSRSLNLPYEGLEDSELPISERLRLVVTIYNRCVQFNSRIHIFDEEININTEGRRLLEVLYCGLSQGYAYDSTNNTSYIGYPADGEWRWTEKKETAEAVRKLIATYKEIEEPQFVSVPLKIR